MSVVCLLSIETYVMRNETLLCPNSCIYINADHMCILFICVFFCVFFLHFLTMPIIKHFKGIFMSNVIIIQLDFKPYYYVFFRLCIEHNNFIVLKLGFAFYM